MTAGCAVAARRLTKHFGRGTGLLRAVDEVDLEVHAGESVAIVGASGCGKSTLLRLLGGLDLPTSGEVLIAGERVDRLSRRDRARLRRRAIGFVFQEFHLVPELTAAENVELPVLLAGGSAIGARKAAIRLLDRMGAADLAGRRPAALSGGERQKVAIARALVNEPLVVLADEPTGSLDSAATTEVLRLFGDLRTGGQTLVVVTHEGRVAGTSDRLVTMRDGALVSEARLTVGPAGGTGLGALAGLVGPAGLADPAGLAGRAEGDGAR
ncbi:ABC transporter ATP-binding protein [Jiangella alkaliphila]|uniref:Putative ABC transport system ATP-binding protein n=1 Tax=Jiangella alkaliphila TaxID=419479 RepID=A0A1H2LXA1_9ACTN|nr:ABC transporter ATP-binding protein [Jiangella alkaliphila]SDU85633.1 putative ABC transport system ATP-binding protein [Jiangella alkaliphila]